MFAFYNIFCKKLYFRFFLIQIGHVQINFLTHSIKKKMFFLDNMVPGGKRKKPDPTPEIQFRSGSHRQEKPGSDPEYNKDPDTTKLRSKKIHPKHFFFDVKVNI